MWAEQRYKAAVGLAGPMVARPPPVRALPSVQSTRRAWISAGTLLLTVVALAIPGGAIFGGHIGPALAPFVHSGSAPGAPNGAAPNWDPTSCAGGSIGAAACAAAAASLQPLSGGPTPPVSWINLTSSTATAPESRWLAALVYDPVDQYVLLFGGCHNCVTSPYSLDGDTWAYSGGTWTQLNPSQSPAPRYAPGIAWDAADGYAVLFGGYNGNFYAFNDTWTFVHGQWSNITGSTGLTPKGAWRMPMTYDGGDGYVLMYGGTDGAASATALTNTWKFLGGVWTDLTANVTGSPPDRYRATMAYDAADGYVVTFGGCATAVSSCTSTPDSTTWSYHNLTWTKLSPTTHPSARVYYALSYSTSYDELLLFGGSTSAGGPQPLHDTWAFTNGNWTNITSTLHGAPSSRAYTQMAFDAVDNYTLLFGGAISSSSAGYQYLGDWFSLGPSLLGRMTVAPAALDVGQPVTINATPYGYLDYVIYDYTSLPSGCTNANASPLICTPDTVGTFAVNATVEDASGTPLLVNATVTVAPDPAISAFGATPAVVTRGAPTNISVVAGSGTGTLTYHYTLLPPGCTSANQPWITCTPGGSASGSYTPTVTVTDQVGYAVAENTTLLVNPTPSLASVVAAPETLDVGQSLTLWANATGGTAPLTYVYAGLPTGCASVDAPTVSCVPTAGGPAAVTVSVTDAFGFAATGSANITVNDAPQIRSSAISPGTVDVGTPFTMWVNATGGGGFLTYAYTGTPSGCAPGSVAQATCTPTSPGNYTIQVVVTDGVAYSVTTSFDLAVNAGLAVESLDVSPQYIDVGQSVTFTTVAAGGTAPLKYIWTGLPGGCTPPLSGGTFSCTPHAASPLYAVGVTVTDHFLSTGSATAELVVYALPTITAFNASSSTVTVHSTVDLSVQISGGSATYTLVYTGLPPGCASDNTTLLVCTPTSVGQYTVDVTATDSLGSSTNASVTVAVVAASSSSTTTSAGGVAPLVAYAIIGLLALVVIVVFAVLLRRRGPARPPRRAPVQAPASEAETEET